MRWQPNDMDEQGAYQDYQNQRFETTGRVGCVCDVVRVFCVESLPNNVDGQAAYPIDG